MAIATIQYGSSMHFDKDPFDLPTSCVWRLVPAVGGQRLETFMMFPECAARPCARACPRLHHSPA